MCQLSLRRRTSSRGLTSKGLFALLIVVGPGLPGLLAQGLNGFDENQAPANPRRFEFQIRTAEGKPVKGATVTPWAVGCRGGSSLVEERSVPPAKSDAEGKVTIVFPEDADLAADKENRLLRDGLNVGLDRVALRVDHPDHPLYSEYLDVAGPRKIELVESTTIDIRIDRRGDPRKVGTLYPVLSKSFGLASNFSAKDGALSIRRVDRNSGRASRWLRVVEIPAEGPARFTDLIDLNAHQGNPVNLEVETKLGARLVGRLAGDVPRPVKNGRVVGQIVGGPNSWQGWSWCVEAEIGPDGKFTIDWLPPGENLQLIAHCDGWISKSPSVEETTAYGREHDFEIESPGNRAGQVQPRLLRLTSGTIVRGIPMQRTSSCEVTVLGPDGKPVSGASVSFWPNQLWFRGGSPILGTRFDSLSIIRDEIATGTRPDLNTLRRRDERFTAKTDDQGLALIPNLPAGGDEESDAECSHVFAVHHDQFELAKGPQSVLIAPGGIGHATVRLKAN